MMQPLCSYLAFTFLCGLSFLSPVLSIDCNGTQYSWPVDSPQLCCNKCQPGYRMRWRDTSTCGIECVPCLGERYIDIYSVKKSCELCENCDKPNMEYKSRCSTTHNSVCRCKADYRCKDLSCKQCVPIPSTTTKPTLPPSTTVLKPGALPTLGTSQPIRDTAWFLVIIALLCGGIALVVVTKIKPFLRWIKSKHDYLVKRPARVLQYDEDEDVSKPVQEVRGKCDVLV